MITYLIFVKAILGSWLWALVVLAYYAYNMAPAGVKIFAIAFAPMIATFIWFFIFSGV